jgi:hypothetical protein
MEVSQYTRRKKLLIAEIAKKPAEIAEKISKLPFSTPSAAFLRELSD